MEDITFDNSPESNSTTAPISIDIEKSVSMPQDAIVLNPDEDIQFAVAEDVVPKEVSKSATFTPKEFKSINQLMAEGMSKEDAINAVNQRRGATTGAQLGELTRQFAVGASKTALGLSRLVTAPYEALTGDKVESVDNLQNQVQKEESYFSNRYGMNIPDIVNKAAFATPIIASAPAMLGVGALEVSSVLGSRIAGKAIHSILNTPTSILGTAAKGASTGGAYEYSNFKGDVEAIKAGILNATIGTGVVLAGKAVPVVARILSKTKFDMEDQAIYDLKQAANISDDEASKLLQDYRKFVDTSDMYKSEAHLLSLLHSQDKSALYKVLSTDKEAASVVRRFLDDQKEVFKAKLEVPNDTIGADSIQYFKQYVNTTDKILDGMNTQLSGVSLNSFNWNMNDVINKKPIAELLSKMEFTPKIDSLLKKSFSLADKHSKSSAGAEVSRLSAADLFSFRNTLEKFRLDNLDKMTSTEKSALSSIFASTNSEISRMAKTTLQDPDKFVSAWRAALIGKRETLELTKNKLYKDINTAGLTEDDIIQKYFKYVNSADPTFTSVIHKLPVNGVKKIESAIISKSFEQYSKEQYVDFIGLNRILSGATFRTAEALEKQKIVAEAAKVFKNNPELREVSDKMILEGDKTGILSAATGIIYSKVNNFIAKYIYSYVPSQEGRKLNMFRRLDDVLDRPNDIKAVKELKSTITADEQQQVDDLIKVLRQHQANKQYLLNFSKGK